MSPVQCSSAAMKMLVAILLVVVFYNFAVATNASSVARSLQLSHVDYTVDYG